MKLKSQKTDLEFELGQRDFLAQGGEGVIYVKNNLAHKIYLDPKKMLPLGKIQELSVLSHPNIIKPEDVLLNSQRQAVGYSMALVRDTYVLCQLFTKTFRDKYNLSHAVMLQLIRKLQELVEYVHTHQILMVDLNELNFLSSRDFTELYAIDVDSYQTPHFPATALMETVRDRHNKTFSTLTDWFAFAITSFQMFTGIHPFKGKHPRFKTLEERMQHHVSVLNSEVGVPSSCYQFNIIPDTYRQWYSAVLDQGKRLPPPKELLQTIYILPVTQTVTGNNQFLIQELQTLDGKIISAVFDNNNKIILSVAGLQVNKDNFPQIDSDTEIAITPQHAIVTASLRKEKLQLFDVFRRHNISLDCTCQEMMSYDNRIYIKNGSNVLELKFLENLNKGMIAATQIVGQVLENSSHCYPGVIIQNLLGDKYVSLFPTSGSCHQIKIPELNDYQIIDAKFDHGVLMILGSFKSSYDKLIFRFDSSYKTYDCRKIADSAELNLNFVVLNTGVCVHLVEEGFIEIFSSQKSTLGLKIIQDTLITYDMLLLKDGNKLLFAKDNKLYSMSMK